MQVIVGTARALARNLNLVRHYDRIRRRYPRRRMARIRTRIRIRKRLHIMHPHMVHHPLLAATMIAQVPRNRGRAGRWSTVSTPTVVIVIAAGTGPAADGLKSRGGFVRWPARCAHRLAEYGAQRRSDKREYHGEVGRDHGDEGFADAPCGGFFCAADRVLQGKYYLARNVNTTTPTPA